MTAADSEARRARTYDAALSVRVDNIESALHGVQGEVRELRTTMASKGDIGAIADQLRIMQADATKLGRPNYSLLSLILGGLIALGGLAYWPMREGLSDLKGHVASQDALMSSQRDRARDSLDAALAELRKIIVTREEHADKWRGFDIQHNDLKASINRDVANLQRQLDELQRRAVDTYSARDIILELRDRLNKLELHK